MTAVEPEPRLRLIAAAAARTAPVPVTVTDQDAALAEIRRVLKPGGVLCFLEHVRAGTARLARIHEALDATIWPHLFGGCHLGRDTAMAIQWPVHHPPAQPFPVP